MRTDEKLKLASRIIVPGLAIAICFHSVLGIMFKLDYPYNTFLYSPTDRFMDFFWPVIISHDPYLVTRPDFQNFPFLYKIAYIFSYMKPATALVIFLSIFIAGMLAIHMIQLRKQGRAVNIPWAIIFTLFTYPVLISFDRANFEILVFFCLYLFVHFYKNRPMTSAFFLGLAAALKGFPAIMGFLLLADKRYRDVVFSACVALLATALSYLSLPGGFVVNINNHLHNLVLYNATYAVNNRGLPYGNSLFGCVKFTMAVFDRGFIVNGTTDSLINGYTIFSVFALLILGIYISFIEKTFWKRVTLLVCLLNLLPLVSGDYKLLHLFIPFYLFLQQPEQSPNDKFIVVLFGLLFIPKAYWRLPDLPEASIAVFINPLLMLTLVTVVMKDSLRFFKLPVR
jgi:hypothetical protein